MGNHNKTGVSQKGQVVVLGIDLSKKSFQLHGVDAKGQVVIRKKLNRKALLPFIATCLNVLSPLKPVAARTTGVVSLPSWGIRFALLLPSLLSLM